MMAASGIAWGWYSLLGRRSVDPVRDTTANFIRSAPLTALASLVAVSGWHLTPAGAAFAALCVCMASIRHRRVGGTEQEWVCRSVAW